MYKLKEFFTLKKITLILLTIACIGLYVNTSKSNNKTSFSWKLNTYSSANSDSSLAGRIQKEFRNISYKMGVCRNNVQKKLDERMQGMKNATEVLITR